jgi:hemerythrin
MIDSNIKDSQNGLEWDDSLLLGFGPMDKVHAEFVDLLGQLRRVPDGEVAPILDILAAHTREHFEMENKWMTETEFPARQCHIDEHNAVLKSVEEVRQLVADGNPVAVRPLAEALEDWFPAHADYLDSALSHWMCMRRSGGKPVVLRRSAVPR